MKYFNRLFIVIILNVLSFVSIAAEKITQATPDLKKIGIILVNSTADLQNIEE